MELDLDPKPYTEVIALLQSRHCAEHTRATCQVANALARTAERACAGLVVVDLDLDTLLAGDAAITARFRAALAAVPRGRVRLAVVDHISSNPPVEFPLPAIVAACRAAGAKGEP